jgi:hypothetical protein
MSKREWGVYDVTKDGGRLTGDPNESLRSSKGLSPSDDDEKAPGTLLAIWGLLDVLALVRILCQLFERLRIFYGAIFVARESLTKRRQRITLQHSRLTFLNSGLKIKSPLTHRTLHSPT